MRVGCAAGGMNRDDQQRVEARKGGSILAIFRIKGREPRVILAECPYFRAGVHVALVVLLLKRKDIALVVLECLRVNRQIHIPTRRSHRWLNTLQPATAGRTMPSNCLVHAPDSTSHRMKKPR